MTNAPVSTLDCAPEPSARVIETSAEDPDVLRRDYLAASPFPHAVFEGVLRTNVGVTVAAWPADDWDGWRRFRDEYQKNKAVCGDIQRVPAALRRMLDELASPQFLGWLEGLTGIEKLLPDPYLAGGGLHMSGPGGVLSPHTDFHHNLNLDLFRRVNVLLYLNEEWDESWGGCLELYGSKDAAQPSRVVMPRWGTMVVFTTDDRSVHGFPRPIVEGKVRRSIAAYYYTAAEAPTYSGDTTTYWRHNDVKGGPMRRARARVYRVLILISRSIAFVAHRLNPKL